MNEKIKDLRHQLKLTQTEFASKLGVSRAVIAQIETKKNNPTSELLQKIYKEFNVDLIAKNVTDNHIVTNVEKTDNTLFLNKSDILLKFNDLRIIYDDNMKMLYFICSILKSRNYKFSKEEKQELRKFKDIRRILNGITTGETKISLENFETLMMIIKISLFRFNGTLMRRAEKILDIDISYNMDEILRDS